MARKKLAEAAAPAPQAPPAYTIQRYGRFWKVLDAAGELVCMTVYKRGAVEVVRKLMR